MKLGRPKIRKLLLIKCLNCNIIFKTFVKSRIFCSLSCSSIYNNSHGGGFSNHIHSKTSKSKIGLKGDKNVSKRLNVRKKISKALKGRINNWTCKLKGQKRPNTSHSLRLAHIENRTKPPIKYRKGNYRKDLHQYFRSSWEANYARILNYLNIKWIYEPKAFIINIDSEEYTYRPDFYLPETDEYIEIKGYWANLLAKLKYKEFAKINKCKLIQEREYKKLALLYQNKILWEGKKYVK